MLCITLTHFAAAVESFQHPELADKPLILTQKRKRGHVVAAVNQLAWEAGVRPFQPLHQAKTRCTNAEIRSANHLAYERLLLEIAAGIHPLVNKLEPEYQPTVASIYLDMPYDRVLLAAIGRIIQEKVGLRVKFGRSEKKFPARVASAVSGAGQCATVTPGDEGRFLSPYRVALLPLPISMARKLQLVGVTTLGELAKLPRTEVWQQFGREGRRMHEMACGEDVRPIVAWTPEKVLSISEEFEDGIADRQMLNRHLQRLAQPLLDQLAGKEAHRLTITVETADGQRWDEERQPEDGIKANNPFFLLRQIQYALDSHPVETPVTRVTLRLSRLKDPLPVQLSLFDEPSDKVKLPNLIPLWLERQPTLTVCGVDLKQPDHIVAEERFKIEQISGAS
ncbi:MAG: hypothetical protein H6670_10955 [Anaerolineaceae bacterium]|nr:hypothetical protein [Anaerolineaceae bacterium]